METYDAIVIGGGPAGLTAATYLARFRWRVAVLGAGPSRASWIPASHNTPGFPHGINGDELLQRLRAQAGQFGADLRDEVVESLVQAGAGFEAETPAARFSARFAILATGVLDRMPALAWLDEAIHRSIVRMCPICDAYEAIGKRIAVLGDGGPGEREAQFLRTYSDAVTLLKFPRGEPASDRAAAAPGFDILEIDLDQIRLTEKGVRVEDGSGPSREFDHLYLALGCEPQSRLARACGAACDADGNLTVDAHQETSVPNLYAAGDVVRGLNQIAVAAGEAAIAATAIHNRLREPA
jgi:thioredoxin reductase (NADPH)